MIIKCSVIINGSYVEINIFFTALITISWVFICMSHVTYHWTHSYTTLTASMAGRVVNLLICATNSRKALAITVTRGVAGVGVTVNDTGGKYARGKYYSFIIGNSTIGLLASNQLQVYWYVKTSLQGTKIMQQNINTKNVTRGN